MPQSAGANTAAAAQSLQPAAPFHLLTHKNWKHRELIAQFLASDYDEAAYLSTTMAQSSSSTLDQLSSLLAEVEAEIRSVILAHHPALLNVNSHILIIESEVATVLRRVDSLRGALKRIQTALMVPFHRLNDSLMQLQHMQDAAEHVRQAMRVLQHCDKLRNIMAPQPAASPAAAAAAAAASAASPSSLVPSTPRTATVGVGSSTPALRDLVKCATLLYDVQQVFGAVNLNGVSIVDAQLPFLNTVAETLHNSGRRMLYESLRGGAGSSGAASPSPAAPHIDQLALNYVVQLFYNLAPNPMAEATLRTLDRAAELENRRARRRGVLAEIDSAASNEDAEEAASLAAEGGGGGGTELVALLDELVSAYTDQARAALRKIFDVAASAHALNLQEAAKRSKRGALGGGASAAASGAGGSGPSPTPTSLRSTLWDRLDSLSELLFSLTIQVWTLSKILAEKHDLVYNAAPGVSFATIYRTQRALVRARQARERRDATKASRTGGAAASAAAAVGDEDGESSLLHAFWRSLCELLRGEFEPIAASAPSAGGGATAPSGSSHSSHNFLRTIFVNEYPRLHALFDRGLVERLARYVAGHAASAQSGMLAAAGAGASGAAGTPTSAVAAAAAAAAMASLTAGSQSADSTPPPELGASERQQLLSAFVPFLQLHLSRSLAQLCEPVTLMFSAHEALGAQAAVPSRSDVGAFVSALSSALASAAESRDPEVQRLQCRAIFKSVQLFVQHAERMLVTEVDRDMFSSSHMPTPLQADAHALAVAQQGQAGQRGLISASAAASMMSQSQRTNLDVFAILLQLERELTEAELTKKHPQLFAVRASATSAPPTSSPSASDASAVALGGWPTPTSQLSPALATLRQCWEAVRALQKEALSVLETHASHNLCSSFPALVVELDAEPGASPATQAAAAAFAAASPPPDGSPAMLAFRRRILYCLHVLFPLYTNALAATGAGSSAASAAAAAAASSSPDVAGRVAMWQSTLVVPLHAALCGAFLRTITLVPLNTAQAPGAVSEPLRAHHASILALFESLIQQLHRQQKRSSRVAAQHKSVGSAGDLSVSASSLSELLAIDGVHAWKELVHSPEGEHLHHHTSRALDPVALLHFLFTNCSLRAGTGAGTGAAAASAADAVAQTSPHRLLQMRVEEYVSFLRTHNQIEIFERFNKVYALLEARIPVIPKGTEGRTFLREHYPNLALALKILTKH